MTNMYEALGVGKDATQEELKIAFRRAAQICHPDKGGSEEAFKRVKEAYEVLSDPARRRTYDETGQTTAQPSVEEEAESLLANIFQQYLDSNETEEPIASMRRVAAKGKDQITADGKRVEKDLTRVNRLVGKLSRKDGGQPTLVRVLEAKVANLTTQKANFDRQLKVLHTVFKVLSQWECQGFEPESTDKRTAPSIEQMMEQFLGRSPYGYR